MNVIIENQDINLHGKISAPVVLCDTAITKKICTGKPCIWCLSLPEGSTKYQMLLQYSLKIFLRPRNVFFGLG